jgi:hypothetical protein
VKVCRAQLGTACSAPDAVAPGCTSRRQHAHIIESRVVLYRWHPWYQQTVYVYGKSARGEQAVLRCAPEQADVARALEIPQWMFDATTCAHISLGDLPSVSVDALRDVSRLMRAAQQPVMPPVLQAEHEHQPGGAYATRDEDASAEGSAGIVSAETSEPDLGKPTDRRADAGSATSRPISTTASRRCGGRRSAA